jgi:hypothetical protein
LNGAWNANPGQPKVADLMLVVEKGIGGDRAAMETWFKRAMDTDANDQEACWSKLDWLDPKWHGGETIEPMMAFGKACRATKNWRAGITLLAADAHLRCYSKLPPQEATQYMSSPEVWSEIHAVYDEYLKYFPDNDVERSKYAALCVLAGRYPEAHAQFQKLGERLSTWSTFPNLPMQTLLRMRDDTARRVGSGRSGDGS